VSSVAAPTTTTTAAPSRRRRRPSRRLIVAMVLAAVIAAAAAYAATTLLGGDDITPVAQPGTPAVVATSGVQAVAAKVGHDVYGVATPAGTRTEVTRGTNGEVWVRYLTQGAAAGDKRANFLTIGTYRQSNALAAAQEAAKSNGQRASALPGGGIMLWSTERPTSVYVARPGSDLLVEVYSPDADQAKALARSGAVVPLN
jgi:hypothetical protein